MGSLSNCFNRINADLTSNPIEITPWEVERTTGYNRHDEEIRILKIRLFNTVVKIGEPLVEQGEIFLKALYRYAPYIQKCANLEKGETIEFEEFVLSRRYDYIEVIPRFAIVDNNIISNYILPIRLEFVKQLLEYWDTFNIRRLPKVEFNGRGILLVEETPRSIFDHNHAGDSDVNNDYYVILSDHILHKSYAIPRDKWFRYYNSVGHMLDKEGSSEVFDYERVRFMTPQEEQLWNEDRLAANVDSWGNVEAHDTFDMEYYVEHCL